MGSLTEEEFIELMASTILQKTSKRLTSELASFRERNFLNIEEYVDRFVKEGVIIPPRERQRYRLREGYQETIGWSPYYSRLYLDAHFMFSLCYGKNLIALISFNALEGRIQIPQIQGGRRKESLLSPLKWERMLLQYVIDWAKLYSIPKIEVISASNNPWVRSNRLPYSQAKMRYDVTAKRCSFTKNEFGNYSLILS